MADPYIGEIRIFGFSFAPVGWALCNGQLLSIAQNTALFALLGTFYGGDGVTTFGLPDLRGRVPIHMGQGLGLSVYDLGQLGGSESITLTSNQMPQHNHTVGCNSATARGGTTFGVGNGGTPVNSVPAPATSPASAAYSNSAPNANMNPSMIGLAGGSQPHSNIQPYLTVTFCIATMGIFPSRS